MKHLISFILGTIVFVQIARAAVVASGPVQFSESAAGGSFNPIFSADGRHLVFISHANNLVTNDDLGLSLDVFVRDLVTSNTVLVSVSTNGFGGANVDANYPSVSSNGQFIAFASRASNLVPGDTTGASDVFVRDLASGTTTLVSFECCGTGDPNPSLNIPHSGYPIISQNGRWVFFESRSTNFGVPDFNNSVDVFGRDIQTGEMRAVSFAMNGVDMANGASTLSAVSADGRYVAFVSTATNIVAGRTNNGTAVYLRDMQSGQIVWATTNCSGCKNPVLDNSGNVIAYMHESSPVSGVAAVYRYDRLAGETTAVGAATNLSIPLWMSADGEVILYTQRGYPNGSIVYEWRHSRGVTNGVGGEVAVALSSDGNFGVIQSTGQLLRVTLTNS
ncbi:MAG TPA: hypothetical protein VNT99_14280, partial [Methylomirabilota bacterium]|nr:hypothetical protein [Methylomirabilota bacterium]